MQKFEEMPISQLIFYMTVPGYFDQEKASLKEIVNNRLKNVCGFSPKETSKFIRGEQKAITKENIFYKTTLEDLGNSFCYIHKFKSFMLFNLLQEYNIYNSCIGEFEKLLKIINNIDKDIAHEEIYITMSKYYENIELPIEELTTNLLGKSVQDYKNKILFLIVYTKKLRIETYEKLKKKLSYLSKNIFEMLIKNETEYLLLFQKNIFPNMSNSKENFSRQLEFKFE